MSNDQGKQKKILFLDDNPDRAQAFLENFPDALWVQNASDCITQLSVEQWDEIYLDHDLGGEIYVDSGREDCGMEVVRYIAENRPGHLKDTYFVVHSFNTVAAKKMTDELTEAGYTAVSIPFTALLAVLTKAGRRQQNSGK